MRAWVVVYRVLGAQMSYSKYFRYKKDADRFYVETDYACKPVQGYIPKRIAQDLKEVGELI